MKACILSMILNDYGQGLGVKKISEFLGKKHEISVIHANEKERFNNFFKSYLIKVPKIPFIDLAFFGKALNKKIFEIEKKQGIDLLYAHSYEFGFVKKKILSKKKLFIMLGELLKAII
jgi:hypothetical protein